MGTSIADYSIRVVTGEAEPQGSDVIPRARFVDTCSQRGWRALGRWGDLSSLDRVDR